MYVFMYLGYRWSDNPRAGMQPIPAATDVCWAMAGGGRRSIGTIGSETERITCDIIHYQNIEVPC